MGRFVAWVVPVLLWGATAYGAPCGARPDDAAQSDAARAAVAAECPCETAASHGAHVSCVSRVLNGRVAGGTLRPACRSAIRRCAARSTCGRPGAATCCRTAGDGRTRCSVKRSAGQCSGRETCVGVFASCCDACVAGGCATSTTTTVVPSTTTTTFVAAPCGGTLPECQASCPAGTRCVAEVTLSGGTPGCRCYPEGVAPCAMSAFPACGGVCSNGNACQAVHVLPGPDSQEIVVCGCVDPATTCGPPPPAACAGIGVCPEGLTCFAGGSAQAPECGCGP